MLVLFDLACVAFFFALVATPFIRDAAQRHGVVDRPGLRKIHTRPIPRVGGVAVALAYTAALGFVYFAPYRNVSIDIPGLLAAVLPLAPAAAVILLTGLLDDLVGLRPWQKLLGQIVAAAMAHYMGFGVHAIRGYELPEWISLPVTVLWLAGCANAVNLVDGMDGLAAGVGLFSSLTILLAALTHQSMELALVTAPLAGSLAGFLRYNFNPASVFLGDSGSLLVGFLIGCYGAYWSQKSATILAMTAPLMALAFPLVEVSISMARRWIRGQGIFTADQQHIHHQLLRQGLTPRRAALLVYGLCGLAAGFAVLQEVAHDQFGGLIVVLFCAAAWLGVQHLGYAEFGVAGRLLFGIRLRGIVNVQLQMQQFERDLEAAGSLEEAWEVICRGCREFGFAGARMRVNGTELERSFAATERAQAWQLRVPLGEDDYLNLLRSADSGIHPVVLGHFPEVAARVLKSRFGRDAQRVEHPEPAQRSSAAGRA